jgi:hypothetical protein
METGDQKMDKEFNEMMKNNQGSKFKMEYFYIDFSFLTHQKVLKEIWEGTNKFDKKFNLNDLVQLISKVEK